MKKILSLCVALLFNYSQASIIFMDGSVTVDPLSWQTNWTGYAINPITIFGTQTAIKIVDQVVDSYSPSSGTLANTDSISQMFSKIGAILPTNYTVLTTATNTTLTAFQRTCVVTAVGQTIKLPASNASGVIAGVPYMIVFPANLTSAGTVGVTTGDTLNGSVNGTYASPISVTVPRINIAISTGSVWFVN